jgi:hypothetical protein
VLQSVGDKQPKAVHGSAEAHAPRAAVGLRVEPLGGRISGFNRCVSHRLGGFNRCVSHRWGGFNRRHMGGGPADRRPQAAVSYTIKHALEKRPVVYVDKVKRPDLGRAIMIK